MKFFSFIIFITFTFSLKAAFENLSADPLVVAGCGSSSYSVISFYNPIPASHNLFFTSINYLIPYELKEFQTSELTLTYQNKKYFITTGINYFGNDNYSESVLLLAPGITILKKNHSTLKTSLTFSYNIARTIYPDYRTFAIGGALLFKVDEITFKGHILNIYSQKLSQQRLPLTLSGDFNYILSQELDFTFGLEKSDNTDLYWKTGFKYCFLKKLLFIISTRNPDLQLGSGIKYSFDKISFKVGISWQKNLGLSYSSGLMYEI